MQIYSLFWEFDPFISSTDGRIKSDDKFFNFTILVDSQSRVIDAFNVLFHRRHLGKLYPEDGKITIQRCKVDSRNIICNYLFLKGMREPLYLVDVNDKRNNHSNIFGLPTFRY